MERKLKEKLANGEFEGQTPGNTKRMRAIKAKGNKSTEVRLRSMLARARVRGWKVHPKGVVGKPDFVFPEHRLAVFVDGCFWHGCPQCGHVPKANNLYWKAKIEGNQRRDLRNDQKLQEHGFRVLRVWEHELRLTPGRVVEMINNVLADGGNHVGSETRTQGQDI
jgi:DNA mismatch endonuclease Vsr